jgi:hypothetical protein
MAYIKQGGAQKYEDPGDKTRGILLWIVRATSADQTFIKDIPRSLNGRR